MDDQRLDERLVEIERSIDAVLDALIVMVEVNQDRHRVQMQLQTSMVALLHDLVLAVGQDGPRQHPAPAGQQVER